MCEKVNETAKGRNDDITALQFYFENRVKINNLYNIAQTARDWIQSIFRDSSFVWDCQVAEPMRTKRPEDKHRNAVYRLPGINELAVVVN